MTKLINSLFKWGWRLSKRDYVFWSFLSWIFVVIFISVIWLLIEWENAITWILIFPIMWLLIAYITINLIVKRLHDLGKPWSHFFLFMIPFYNIYMFFKLLLEKWEEKTNDYGEMIVHSKKIPIIARIWIVIWWIAFFIWIFMFVIIMIIKGSWAYQLAIETITSNKTIISEFWKVETWLFPMWQISTSWPVWEANLQINIDWEKKNWAVYISLKKEMWKWSVVHLVTSDESWNEKEIIKKAE